MVYLIIKSMAKAVIFDMDGVLIDDERFKQQSWIEYGKRHGFNLTEADVDKFLGRTSRENFDDLYKRKLTGEEFDRYHKEKTDILLELLKGKLKPIDGVQELLDVLLSNHIKMAVATSSRRFYFDFIIGALNFKKYFPISLTADDIKKGKPDPEIYLKAAEMLHVKPTDCIVFEDSVSGITSGKTAGMKVIAITTTHAPSELHMADKIIKSFREISVKDLL